MTVMLPTAPDITRRSRSAVIRNPIQWIASDDKQPQPRRDPLLRFGQRRPLQRKLEQGVLAIRYARQQR
jgi:hypothetical protein